MNSVSRPGVSAAGSALRRAEAPRAIPGDPRRFTVLTNDVLGVATPGAWGGTLARQDNLLRCLRTHAAERPGAVAFIGLDDSSRRTTLTYADLDRRARAIASHLQDLRLAGERVMLAYPPGLEIIAAFFGALYAGCIAVPVYPPHRRTLEQFDSIRPRQRAA